MSDSPITVLPEDDAIDKLQTNDFGRIGIRHEDDVDIIPINYVTEGTTIYFRTAEGNKLSTIMSTRVWHLRSTTSMSTPPGPYW